MKPAKLLKRLASGAVTNVSFADVDRGETMKTPNYHINIFFSAEDRGFVADIPDLACCSAMGATPQEALEEVVRARDAWLAAARRAKKHVPAARYRPAIYQIAR